MINLYATAHLMVMTMDVLGIVWPSIDLTNPNWGLFWNAWMIGTIAVCILFPPAGLLVATKMVAVRIAARIAGRWILKSAAKAVVPAYLVACVQWGGSGGTDLPNGPGSGPVTPAATRVVISFDTDHTQHEQVHVLVDGVLIQASSLEMLMDALQSKLAEVHRQGVVEAVFHIDPYPGPDLDRRIMSLCRGLRLTVQVAEQPFTNEPEAGR